MNIWPVEEPSIWGTKASKFNKWKKVKPWNNSVLVWWMNEKNKRSRKKRNPSHQETDVRLLFLLSLDFYIHIYTSVCSFMCRYCIFDMGEVPFFFQCVLCLLSLSYLFFVVLVVGLLSAELVIMTIEIQLV